MLNLAAITLHPSDLSYPNEDRIQVASLILRQRISECEMGFQHFCYIKFEVP